MNNYDVSNYMRKFYSPIAAGEKEVDHGDEEVVNPDITSSTKERKPRTRLSKWLAKIAGVYDGEMEPKTEAEYYLNEIAQKDSGSGGVFVVHIDDSTFDKTMGEIKEAWDRGDKIDVIAGFEHHAPVILNDVHYVPMADPPAYIGYVYLMSTQNQLVKYTVNAATEADALNAYPNNSKGKE